MGTYMKALGVGAVYYLVAVGMGYWWHTNQLSVVETNKLKPLPDFSSISDVRTKKSEFFHYLIPLIEIAQEQILEDRQWLLERLDQWDSLSESELDTALSMAETYKSDPDPEKLLLKVDVWPTSLVLAQAALESAWGTSRFAKEGNNLFGQWCYSQGCGLVPNGRDSGAKHEVRKFNSVFESILAYHNNLNRHYRYEELRRIRLNFREQEQPLDSMALTEGLSGYSERGQDYIDEVKAVIRFNKLRQYDHGLSS